MRLPMIDQHDANLIWDARHNQAEFDAGKIIPDYVEMGHRSFRLGTVVDDLMSVQQSTMGRTRKLSADKLIRK